VRSIAFPAISCGVFGYPIDAAVKVALAEVRAWVAENALPDRIVFCCYSNAMERAYRRQLDT